MTYGPPRRPTDRLRPRRAGRFAAVDHRGRVTALVAEGLPPDEADFGALGIKTGPTSTSDDAWDGPANEKNLDNDDGEKEYRQAYAWVDPDADPDTKSAYSFIHHFVSADGDVGAASTKACSSGVGILNGGRGASKSAAWWDDRQGIYNHLVGHLKASGVKDEDLPELDDMAVASARANWVDWCVEREQRLFGRTEADAADVAWRVAFGAGGPGDLELLDQFGEHQFPDGLAVHEKFTGKHSHAHSAMGSQGGDETHDHEHSHAGDASHGHAHGASSTVRSAGARTTERSTPVTSPEDLAAKVEAIRERHAAAPHVERIPVVVASVGGAEVALELAVRWDPDAVDPLAPLQRDGTVARGAFVSTLEGSDEFAMVAAGADVPEIVESPGGAWHAILCVEGLRTDEDPGREIMPGACQFPDLPVSLRLQIRDEGGHWGAVTCGRIDTMERQELDGYNAIYATGVFGSDENGQTAQLLVEEQTQRFISIDPRNVTMEIVEIEINTSNYYEDDDEDCDPDLYDWWFRYSELTIGAATIVAQPALQQAVIAPASMDLPETPIAVSTAPPSTVILASGEEELPLAACFEDPGFYVGDPRLVRQADGHYACPLTVEGRRVFGHVAYWGANHTGFPGKNRKPPHSPTYAYFMTGARLTAEGAKVPVGNLTMGCGHASTSIRDAGVAKSHYATPVAHYDGGYGAVQMADVAGGEDDFGIWVAGVLCEDVTAEQVRRFESMGMSGDWREIAGKLHLVAVLAVPVPGFPIAREDALVASAEVVDLRSVRAGLDESGDAYSLVAAGRVRRQSPEERLAVLEGLVDELLEDLSGRRRRSAVSALAALVDA